MSSQTNYWTRKLVSRRAALRAAAAAGGGLAALSLIGCGGGGGGGEKQAAGEKPKEVLDPTKGKQGGKLIWQGYGDPGGGLEMVKIRNAGVHQMAGLTHDGLLEFVNGTPAFPGTDAGTQPNLAQALPEISPDKLSYTFKLRPAKFHNGRTVTSEDVKYSYDTYAFASESAVKIDWPFLDKVEAPDPQTVVVKTKYPYADALQSFAQRYYSDILCREHQESADAEKKLLGSGPYLFVEYNPPLITRYKRNPNYHRQPYPYFEDIDRLGTSDSEKKIADFASKQVHVTYWFPPEERDRVKKLRPDAQLWTYFAGSSTAYMRTDKPPFNDKRVRQALSMAMDRKAIAAAVTNGEGEPDQALSWTGLYWTFRKPAQLGAAAKYWNYDVAEAKKLLAAAGVTLPLKAELPTWNATVIGQKHVDNITLITTQWRNNGVLDAKLVEMTFGQFAGGPSIGNYDSIYWGPNTVATVPDIGAVLKRELWSPPEGLKPPTGNQSYVNNQELSALVDKQLGQFNKEERIQTFRKMEDILAEEQYRIASVTSSTNWFGDSSLRNSQMPREAYNGATPYMKYWWFA